ncbi:MAG: hypothetical protein MJY75_07090, partial [Bacteroidaceae bacterium]|nr:hypothetical protein [Bacteroidaceae bacterium]
MKTLKTIALIFMSVCMAGTLASCGSSKNAQGQKKMTPAKKGYAETGKYRNYFRELGIPQEDIDKKIADVYAEIFENPEGGAYKDVDVEVDGQTVHMGYV